MERDDNRMIFNQVEQTEFGVEPVVTVESALKTADVFLQVADTLNAKAESLLGNDNYRQLIEARNARIRAQQMRSFAGGIMMQCPSEVISEVLKSLPGYQD